MHIVDAMVKFVAEVPLHFLQYLIWFDLFMKRFTAHWYIKDMPLEKFRTYQVQYTSDTDRRILAMLVEFLMSPMIFLEVYHTF